MFSREANGLRVYLCGLTVEIAVIFLCVQAANADTQEHPIQWQGPESEGGNIVSHSCIHDQIIEQRRRPGRKVYSVTPQVYDQSVMSKSFHHKGRALLGISELQSQQKDAKQPIRIFLNYDAVGHSPDRDCQKVGDIVKLGEPPVTSFPGTPSCNPLGNPPTYGDCWYNCTLDDISGEDKRRRLHKALGQTADWFRRALAVEPVKGNLRLSGYSACGQDGGVQLPHEYVEEGVSEADLVLLVTTRPTTGNTLAWAVACERDQWGRAIAGHVNVAPRHLTAEAETLLSATLIHEVMHVLGFDPHAFAHFRDDRKRRRVQVTEQVMDEKLGRMVTRVVLPRVVMHSRHHYGAFSENFTGLELEDGGGRGIRITLGKRLLMNEIMTGSVDTRSVVSKMTLALLEDSGWGHTIATQPSYQVVHNREAEGYCPIVSYSGDLPLWARYFPQPNKGGQSSLADYCTYFVAYSDGSCTDATAHGHPTECWVKFEGVAPGEIVIETFLVRAGFVRGSVTQGNGCYQHRCVNKSLEVAVDGIWKVCPEAGGPVQFPGFNGELICPAFHELCSTGSVSVPGQCPSSCYFNGDCVDGNCHCFLGFHGHDCSNAPALVIAMGMACAFQMGTVNAKMVTLALTVLPLLVMNNAAFMVGFVIMEFANSDAQIMQATHISIQKCDNDGDDRLRVCHSACQSYNLACGASLDCSDQTLFSSVEEGEGQCTGSGEMKVSWLKRLGIRKKVACDARALDVGGCPSLIPNAI
ncbi:hypothetical protein GH714_040728 [Hevea brasiliensis]|uniref:EGF-like domain-containing protein n=1 Tax=Hevea brasiliensis TaxID=3981 RepID=A0A6A6MUT6_HEVBR|nr:hypothetical protein GH714_040728 [Hevea brasiliensis]